MDWAAVSAIAGVLAAAFIGFTVVYLALQMPEVGGMGGRNRLAGDRQ